MRRRRSLPPPASSSPNYVPAYVNAADAFRQQGRDADAIRTLKEGIAVQPSNATLHHALGLAYTRGQQRDSALVEFARSVQLAPDNPRYTYVYAVALNSMGAPPTPRDCCIVPPSAGPPTAISSSH